MRSSPALVARDQQISVADVRPCGLAMRSSGRARGGAVVPLCCRAAALHAVTCCDRPPAANLHRLLARDGMRAAVVYRTPRQSPGQHSGSHTSARSAITCNALASDTEATPWHRFLSTMLHSITLISHRSLHRSPAAYLTDRYLTASSTPTNRATAPLDHCTAFAVQPVPTVRQ